MLFLWVIITLFCSVFSNTPPLMQSTVTHLESLPIHVAFTLFGLPPCSCESSLMTAVESLRCEAATLKSCEKPALEISCGRTYLQCHTEPLLVAAALLLPLLLLLVHQQRQTVWCRHTHTQSRGSKTDRLKSQFCDEQQNAESQQRHFCVISAACLPACGQGTAVTTNPTTMNWSRLHSWWWKSSPVETHSHQSTQSLEGHQQQLTAWAMCLCMLRGTGSVHSISSETQYSCCRNAAFILCQACRRKPLLSCQCHSFLFLAGRLSNK